MAKATGNGSKKRTTTTARLVQMARGTVPPGDYRSKSFLDKLSEEDRTQLVELKRAWRSGELPGWSPRALYEGIVIPSGMVLGIGLETFRKWINE